jgi:hypothetical protein
MIKANKLEKREQKESAYCEAVVQQEPEGNQLH